MRGAGCFDLGGDFDGRQCEGVVVVDTQRGQVCIQPAAEGGMVRGPRVGGEQLPGMGGTRVGDETPSEVGFGGQPGAHETLGEPIGLQATPRSRAASKLSDHGLEMGACVSTGVGARRLVDLCRGWLRRAVGDGPADPGRRGRPVQRSSWTLITGSGIG